MQEKVFFALLYNQIDENRAFYSKSLTYLLCYIAIILLFYGQQVP
mgnify:CR=1 FL=1